MRVSCAAAGGAVGVHTHNHNQREIGCYDVTMEIKIISRIAGLLTSTVREMTVATALYA